MSSQLKTRKSPPSFWNSRLSPTALICAGLVVIFLLLNVFGEKEVIPIFNAAALCFPLLMRFVKRHPLFRSTYRDWLKTTPWQPNQPLPLGDVMLELQDFLLLAIATALAFQSPLMMTVPIVFLALHLVLVETSLSLTKTKFESYCILFASIGILWLFPHLTLVVIALLALEPIKRRGHRRSLETLPWEHIKKIPIEGHRSSEPKLGHYEAIRSDIQIEERDRTDALLVSVLLGFLGMTIAVRLPMLFDLPVSSPEMTVLLRGVLAAVPIAFAVMRLVRFKMKYRSPIDLFGRVFAGLLIHPEHDRVYIVPMLLVLVAAVFTALVSLTPAIAFALGWGLSCWLLITGRPTLREWIYTGQIRFSLPSPSDEVHKVRK